MKLIYIKSEDKYIDIDSEHYPGVLYTDDDLDLLLQIESEYRKQLPDYTLNQLIEMYPSAKQAAKRSIKQKLKDLKVREKNFYEFTNLAREQYSKGMNPMEEAEFKKAFDEDVVEKEKEFETEKKKYKYQLGFIDTLIKKEKVSKKKVNAQVEEVKEQQKGVTAEDIERAKQIPISHFLKVRRDGKANCFLHNDKTPSLHVYAKQNKYHCFSCNSHGTVIDIVMSMQGLDFIGAVKYLLNI